MTKSEMESDNDTFNKIKEMVRKFTKSFDEDFKGTPVVTGRLHDKNGKVVYTVNY
jgi:hypothetical protein